MLVQNYMQNLNNILLYYSVIIKILVVSSAMCDGLAICYHLCNLKTVTNTCGGVLLIVKLQVKACNFTKNDTPPWVFFTF